VTSTDIRQADEKDSQLSTVNQPNGTAAKGKRRRRLTQEQQREIARLYAETETPTPEIRALFGLADSSLYRVLQRQGVALRGRVSGSGRSATDEARAEPIARTQSRRGRPRSASARIGSTAEIHDGAAARGGAHQFRVRFIVERVFDARDVRDALRQAQSLGATDVEAIKRE
jgi:transposase-like protein